MRLAPALLAAIVAFAVVPADAQRLSPMRGEQMEAYRANRQGEILSLPEIRARVRVPNAEFIGADFDGRVYRLKYMRGSEVIWIDVDARTGRVLGRQ